MEWHPLVAYFFGGLFVMNAVPHLASGTTGRPFQSPFATPRGIGLSSSTVNVLWGCFNLGVAYLLLGRVGDFGWRNDAHMVALGTGVLLMGVFHARHFGALHGGNRPESP